MFLFLKTNIALALLGGLFTHAFANAETSCKALANRFGQRCVVTLSSYPQPIWFFVPKNVNDQTNVFLYLHGLNPKDYSAKQVIDHYQLDRIFEASISKDGKKSIFVFIPSKKVGRDAMADYQSVLMKEEKAKIFFRDLELALNRFGRFSKTPEYALACHSGSYKVALHWLEGRYVPIKKLLLIDAMYGGEGVFIRFANEGGSFFAANTISLSLKLKNIEKRFNRKVLRSSVLNELTQSSAISFYDSSLDHWKIVNEVLPFYLIHHL